MTIHLPQSYLLFPCDLLPELVLPLELFPDPEDSLFTLPSFVLFVSFTLVFTLSALGCGFGFSFLFTWV
ncbi:MAG: hypothetical protein ABII96_07460, partial [Candidatus Zixiibacteriota bacterium]